MQHIISARLNDTPGYRALYAAYGVVAVAGAVLALVVVSRLTGGMAAWRYDLWIALSGGVSAALAFYLSTPRMGYGGLSGAFRAAAGVVLTSFVASLVAGSLILPVYGTMFGPFSLIVTFAAAPAWAALWLGAMVAAHRLLGFWRAERESVFAPVRATPRRRDQINRRP